MMRKPDWAETWNEGTFDYGRMVAYAAGVGPFKQAIRTHTSREIKPAVYRDEFPRLRATWGEGEFTIKIVRPKTCISPGIYETLEPDEDETHATLEDWFKQRARECREFLPLAEERGW